MAYRLEKTPAKISILKLLKVSSIHKYILYKILQGSGVSIDIDPSHLQAMVGNIDQNDGISFDQSEFPLNNHTQNLSLYIEVFLTRRKIKIILVVNGLGLNICTLKLMK